jgi:hypothetical protein
VVAVTVVEVSVVAVVVVAVVVVRVVRGHALHVAGSPFLTADGAEVFVRWQTPVVRWQNLSSRPGYVRIHTVTVGHSTLLFFYQYFDF